MKDRDAFETPLRIIIVRVLAGVIGILFVWTLLGQAPSLKLLYQVPITITFLFFGVGGYSLAQRVPDFIEDYVINPTFDVLARLWKTNR